MNIEELKTEKNESNILEEFNLNTNLDNLESITLKKPNQVYYEMYKQAREKAKEAKKNAILAYLEFKNIKKTYMLDNIDSEDDDDVDEDYDDYEDNNIEDELSLN